MAKQTVSERDLRLLEWAGEQYGARLDHVQALMDVTAQSSVRIAMGHLRRVGLVAMKRFLTHTPAWVIPTKAGLEICGLPYRHIVP